ncbi:MULTISPECIES: hypothetical protein [Rubrivivax]|uniref:Glycerate kinase n=1 Tax=Rubrivivax benzoatilyticus TaxID=316997 RepID=A0ABX0HZ24_9BURK|nr:MULTISPECIES: hypothetical protein [Rubrivivax]MCD0421173.1 hypothetical protein [Rubrivivax sp. JA1024]EGJ12411.1 hypothetical protein RBXJA2T_18864 [Rubrivivax benzoatilyticus JA2 = ATCC BAA-35]MCC9596858.1 hypothetical protein [Rubrivivax sp. JA1055]MCC9649014.1 hypothetical protein [Rubrivivax sp. JA1029]NHK98846.1 hypothetical protein [Rubrivivax benzoatilyticus]
MNAWIGWALAAAAIAAGYVGWGWQGVVLGITVTVFWLLLQFSRALRAMQQAAKRPRASVASAVALHAKLEPGLSMLQVMKLTGSIGEKVGDDPETFAWRDAGGDAVHVAFTGGRVGRWQLLRATAGPDAGTHPAA